MKPGTLTSVLIAIGLSLSGCLVATGDRLEAAPVTQASADNATLIVRFEGIENPAGQIMLSLTDSAAAHDQDGPPVRVAAVPVEGANATARFEGLSPGEYAIKAFHDLDSDGEMDTNPFGMPIEPFAFSNNARADGGPALWEAARFRVTVGENTVLIAIK